MPTPTDKPPVKPPKPDVIVPTIGATVLVRRRIATHDDTEMEHGIIAFTHNDRLVNVGALNKHGITYSIENLRLVQPKDDIPATGDYCYWPD